MASELRAGIAGTGFIGAVHARSARLAGARITAVAASSLESAQRAARDARRRARLRLRRGARRRTRTSTSCTSARPTTCTCRSPRRRSPPASTSSARSRWRSTRPARGASSTPRRAGPADGGPVRLPLLPDRARGAPARRATARPASCACCTAPTCRTGCCAPTTTTGASTRRWAAARAPSPTSDRTGATWRSSSRATASRACRRGC